jgi:hypothetical protein
MLVKLASMKIIENPLSRQIDLQKDMAKLIGGFFLLLLQMSVALHMWQITHEINKFY